MNGERDGGGGARERRAQKMERNEGIEKEKRGERD